MQFHDKKSITIILPYCNFPTCAPGVRQLADIFHLDIRVHKKEDISVLLNDEYFQIIKCNVLNEAVGKKACLAVPLKFGNVGIEPYRLAKVKLVTDFLDCMENLVCAGLRAVVTYYGILKHVVILKGSCP